MKLISLALFFIATTAFASPSLTWDEIKAYPGFHPAFPTVSFDGAAISVDALCVDGETLRSLQPQRQRCVAWEQNAEDAYCVQYENIYLKTSIARATSVCAEWEATEQDLVCRRYVEENKIRPLSYMVEVHDGSSFLSESGELKVLFEKEYTIPACN